MEIARYLAKFRVKVDAVENVLGSKISLNAHGLQKRLIYDIVHLVPEEVVALLAHEFGG